MHPIRKHDGLSHLRRPGQIDPSQKGDSHRTTVTVVAPFIRSIAKQVPAGGTKPFSNVRVLRPRSMS